MRDKASIGTLEIYTHGVRILGKDDRVKVAARRVLNNWVVKGERKVEDFRGELVTEEFNSQIYGAFFANNNDFWLHKGQMKEFETELQVMGLHPDDFVIKVVPVHNPGKVKFNLKKGRVLRDYQENARDFALKDTLIGDHFSKLIAMPTGTGKMSPLSTPILTPTGWTPLGELKLGEDIISVDGNPGQVLAIVPHGMQEVYNIYFSDGRMTKAGGPHLWQVHNYDWRNTGWRTKTTLEIKEYLEKKKSKIRIPLYSPRDTDDVDLLIDPYLLGLLIGDGSLIHSTISFAKSDDFFEDVLHTTLPKGTVAKRHPAGDWTLYTNEHGRENQRDSLTHKLDKLGMMGKRAWEKSIPKAYMDASLRQKKELIRGLMDTDGTADKAGGASFCTTSEELAMQFIELVRSVGWIASFSTRIPRYTHNGEKKLGRKAWIIHIRAKVPSELFHLPRKKERMKESNQYSEKLALTIDKIEFAGFEECACIQIDHPSHLYVCNDYIVTHNTVTACGTATELGQRWILAVLPKYAKKWQKDLDDNLDVGPKGIMLVEKTTQLRGLIDMCKTQGTKKLPPTVIITLSTLRAFYELYREDAEECVNNMGCAPWELGRILDAGMLTIDEAHEHINTVFLTSMYLHGLKFVSLSGTMRTEDAFQERVQNVVFPQIKRYTDVKMKRYIDVEFISYSFVRELLPKIRYQAFGRTDYNHPTFEASIMKNPQLLNGYLKLVTDLIDYDYIPRRADRRALIFVGTVELADKMIVRLNAKYPHLNVIRYCAAQGDKKHYEEIFKADLIVSTLQSSGTAIDIPNLISVVCTTLVNSSKTNIQCLGRLRELPNGEKVTMYMPYNRQNPKHLKYMAFRYELFKDITKSIKTFNYDSVIGML